MVVIANLPREAARHCLLVLLGVLVFGASIARAQLLIHAGPPAILGGPSPATIPPQSIYDYEAVWITRDHHEISFGLYPGVLYGKRFTTSNGTYIALGAGVVSNSSTFAPGVYSGLGINWCSYLCFSIEYKQALGLVPSSFAMLNPYAIRFGITLFNHPDEENE